MGENDSTSSSRSDTEDLECPICLEVLKNENKIVTPCGHKFCKVCIYRWLDKAEGGKRKCFKCNYEISRYFLKSISKNNTKAESEKSSEAVVPQVINPSRLPLNMFGYSSNSIRSRNGRIIINDKECEDGYYEQDGLKITIEKGIFTSIDEKGRKTCFGGNITGVFSWNKDNDYGF